MKFVKSFLCPLLLILPLSLFGQDLHYDQFTTDDGLPSNTIYEIAQDSSGLLWIGTENGLVSYDGTSFKRFSDSRLKDNDIIELEISKEGHVTFSNISNQYCRLEGKDVVVITIVPHLNDPNSVGTIDLFTYNNVDFLSYSSNVNSSANKLYIYDSKLIDTKADSLTCLFTTNDNGDVFIVKKNVVRTLEVDQESISIGSSELLSYYWLNKPTPILSVDNGHNYMGREFGIEIKDSLVLSLAKNERILDLLYHENLTIIGLYNGLLLYDSIEHRSMQKLEGIRINKLFKDIENNLWLSTDSKGLLRIKLSPKMLYEFNTLSSDVKGLIPFNERVNLITNNSILEIDTYNRKFHKILLPRNSDPFMVADSLKIAVFGNGFLFFNKITTDDGSDFVRLDLIDFVPKAGCFVDGNVIFANRRSVFELSDYSTENKFKKKTKLFDLKKVQCLKFNKKSGLIYIGTAFGAYTYSFKSGLKKTDIKSLRKKSINNILIAEGSRVLYGTANNGVFLVKNGVLKDSFTVQLELLSNAVNSLAFVDSILYVATPKGISRTNIDTRNTLYMTKFEGLTDSNVESICLNEKRNLLISQKKGYLLIEDDKFHIESKDYPIYIDKLYVNNDVFRNKIDQDFVFAFDENKLDFVFEYITLNEIGKKNVRFKLNNDIKWSSGNGLIVGLPSLSPGDYTLIVQGVLTNYKYTQEKIIYITVLPPWWQTWWARLLGILGIMMSIYIYLSLRSKRLMDEESSRLENLKNAEASKREYLEQINKVKDQALQLQMNPHFIFNAMNAIQSFITSGKEKDATLYLAKFAKLIRLIFEYSNARVISMEAELEFVKLYIELEQLRFSNSVKCVLKVSESIENEIDVLRVPPLLVQPLIENSFKHGLFHNVTCGELKITYSLDGNTIVTVIEDNGIGRVASKAIQGARYNEKRHSGLKNIKQRLEIFKYNMPDYINSLEVEDLYIENNACGTRTTIKVTINENQ